MRHNRAEAPTLHADLQLALDTQGVKSSPLILSAMSPLMLLLASPGFAESSTALSLPNLTAFERTLKAEMAEHHAPGVSVAIVQGEKLIYSKAFGVASIETKEKLRPETLFRVASVTKMITAAAVITTALEKGVPLSQPIGKKVEGLAPEIAEFTPHQLLSHSAGLVDVTAMQSPQDEAALATQIKALKGDVVFTEAGEAYSYSNLGFGIAGFFGETLAKTTYAEMVQDTVLTPLDMKRATYRPTMAMTYPLAQGHTYHAPTKKLEVLRPVWNNTVRWPSGFLFCSAPVFSQFCIAMMNGGRYGAKQALPAETVRLMLTPQMKTGGTNSDRAYSYGLNVLTHRGVKVAQHAGAGPGFGTIVRMAPDLKLGIVVFANGTNAVLEKSADAALSSFTKLAPEPAPLPEVPLTEKDIQEYSGRYKNAGLDLELKSEGGKLYMIAVGDTERINASKVGPDLLSLRFGNPELEKILKVDMPVIRGKDGKPKYLYLVGRALRRQ